MFRGTNGFGSDQLVDLIRFVLIDVGILFFIDHSMDALQC